MAMDGIRTQLSRAANALFYRLYNPHWPAFDALIAQRSRAGFYFVQVGANDGVTHDLLHPYIVAERWRGVLVEPVHAYCERLRETYRGLPGLAIEEAAISTAEGIREIHRIGDHAPELPPWSRGLASFHREVIRGHRFVLPGLEGYLVSEPVRCITFQTLFRKHGVREIDLLSIDTEGHDYEIIQTLDFNTLKPRMIVYEHKHIGHAGRRGCRELLSGQGYRLTRHLGNTLAYLP